MSDTIIDEIKKRGYWRVNFRPRTLSEKITKLGECLEIVTKSKVSLRGWSYPHVPTYTAEHKEVTPGKDYYQGQIVAGCHLEFWRMYQSTQFIHYFSLWEDWQKEDTLFGGEGGPEPGTCLSVIGAVYHITEIFEFLRRLIENGLYDEGVRVDISLHNTKGRKLWINDPMRAPFMTDYITSVADIEYAEEFSKEDILLKSKDHAFDCILHFFDRFGWHQANVQAIKNDQDTLLSGRI